MSSDGLAIWVDGVSKHYLLFDRPEDRMKQMVVSRLCRLLGRESRRYYRDFAALHDVSFRVRRGETVGIIGRNGSGKSTLLQIVCGTLQASSGKAAVYGRVAALLELGSGFNPDFSGRENVYLNAAILGMPRSEVEAKLDDILRFADIGEFVDQPVRTYSSGMVVRLAFATAVHVDPEILVVDEALAVGDEAFQRKCFARIELLRERGVTVLFVSHSAQTIVQLCDRAIWVDQGRIRMDGSPKDVVDAYQQSLMESAASAGPAPASPVVAEPMRELMLSAAHREYAMRGGRIEAVFLLDGAGCAPSQLQHGSRYRLRYRLRLDEPVTGLRCGMLVKTASGIEVGGAVVGPSHDLDTATPGVLEVEFEFTCLLAPGHYFLNCGAMATAGGDEYYVHRLVDAFEVDVIRVEPRNSGGVTPNGLVDLQFSGTFRVP